MTRFLTVLITAGLVAGATFQPAPAEAQIESGLRVRQIFEEVPLQVAAKFGCLEYCIELELEVTAFNCRPFLAPPIERCDLPGGGADPTGPTVDPNGFGEACVPAEPELAGFDLEEEHQVVRRTIRHLANCTSVQVGSDQVLQTLPPTNNPPRSCPDGGAWSNTEERILSFRFVPCP